MSQISEYRRTLAYRAGRKAAETGKPRESNNRQRGTIYYDDWGDGYEDGLTVTNAPRLTTC